MISTIISLCSFLILTAFCTMMSTAAVLTYIKEKKPSDAYNAAFFAVATLFLTLMSVSTLIILVIRLAIK